MFWVMTVSGKGREHGKLKVNVEPDEYKTTSVLRDDYFYPIDLVLKKGNGECRVYLTKDEAEKLSVALITSLSKLDAVDIERRLK